MKQLLPFFVFGALQSTGFAATIFSDDFSGLIGTNLASLAPDTGTGSWAGSTLWKADGTANVTTTNTVANAYLPTTGSTITSGNSYTLSFTLGSLNNVGNGNNRQFNVGFTGTNTLFDGTDLYMTFDFGGNNFAYRFQGGATPIAGATAATTGIFSLVLNTTTPTWTAQWFLANTAISSSYALASATQTAFQSAGSVGFGLTTSSNKDISADLNGFTLSAIPEPTGAIAGLLLGVGFLRRNRR